MQTAIVQRLNTRNLTLRNCGWRSHHTLGAEEDVKRGQVVQCIIHPFFKDIFIGVLPTMCFKKKKKHPQNRSKLRTWQELSVSSSSTATAADLL